MTLTQQPAGEPRPYLYLCESDGYIALGPGPGRIGEPAEPCPKHNGPPRWQEAGFVPTADHTLNPTADNVQALARRLANARIQAFRDFERWRQTTTLADGYLDALALRLPCPWCRARSGKPCRTRRSRALFPRALQQFHAQRVKRAKAAAQRLREQAGAIRAANGKEARS